MAIKVQPMDRFQLLWRAGRDLIGHRGRRQDLPFPVTINNLTFKESLFPGRSHNKFQFALYTDAAGKEYIAKQLSLRDPGIDEYWLRNEISVYAALTELSAQKTTELQKQFPAMGIPQLVGVVDDGTRLISVMEKVAGVPLTEFPIKQRMETMERAIAYFRFVNTIHDFKHEVMTRRSMFQVVILSFLALAGALLKNPARARDIIKAHMNFLADSPWLITQTEQELIHRDIGYTNVLVDGDKSSIIDFELSSYMHPMFEITQMVIGCWTKEGFPELFSSSETMRKIRNNPAEYRLYRLLTIYSGIHALATHSKKISTKEKMAAMERYFEYAMTL